MRPTDQSRPPWRHPVSCSLSRNRVASAGVLYVWFLQRVVDRRRQVEELGDPAAGRVDAAARSRAAGEARDPQAAVGGEALLRGEVVDVGLGDVDRQAAGAGGGVDQDEAPSSAPGDALDGDHDTGRRLVVREGVRRRRPPRPAARVGARARRRSRSGRRGTAPPWRPWRTSRRTRRRTRCCARCSIRPNVAMSQKAVVPPLPRMTS